METSSPDEDVSIAKPLADRGGMTLPRGMPPSELNSVSH
jgi:hypothetical protein